MKRYDTALTIGLPGEVLERTDSETERRGWLVGELVREWMGQTINRFDSGRRRRTRA